MSKRKSNQLISSIIKVKEEIPDNVLEGTSQLQSAVHPSITTNVTSAITTLRRRRCCIKKEIIKAESDSTGGDHQPGEVCCCVECRGKILIKGDWQEEEKKEIKDEQLSQPNELLDQSQNSTHSNFQTLDDETTLDGSSLSNEDVDESINQSECDDNSHSDFEPDSDNSEMNYSIEDSDSESEQQDTSEDCSDEESESFDSAEGESLAKSKSKIRSKAKRKDPYCQVITLRLDCPVDSCEEYKLDREQLRVHLFKKHRIKRYRCRVAGGKASFSKM